MNFKIVTFEKHQSPPLRELEEEYKKRLSKYCKLEVKALRRVKIRDSQESKILLAESEQIQNELQSSDKFVVLDASGKTFDSEGLAQQLDVWQKEGKSTLVFFIGGPLGIHPSLKQKADFVLALSPLTFTHEMTRMLLCEALYRSFDLLNNGNYHK